MITGAIVKQQMIREVVGSETVNEQYARLGVDDKSIRAELLRAGSDEFSAAAVIGGICIGLEFADKLRYAHEPTESHDEFLSSIEPDGEDFA